jgi:hypothetical protein
MTEQGPPRIAQLARDRRVVLSTLWIFAVLNYIYADVFTVFFDADALGVTMAFDEWSVLAFSVLMETAIAMVVISRLARRRWNRWANIAAGVLHTAAVAFSAFTEAPAPYYAFFATIEIACTVFIVWYAWTWPAEKHQATSA